MKGANDGAANVRVVENLLGRLAHGIAEVCRKLFLLIRTRRRVVAAVGHEQLGVDLIGVVHVLQYKHRACDVRVQDVDGCAVEVLCFRFDAVGGQIRSIQRVEVRHEKCCCARLVVLEVIENRRRSLQDTRSGAICLTKNQGKDGAEERQSSSS